MKITKDVLEFAQKVRDRMGDMLFELEADKPFDCALSYLDGFIGAAEEVLKEQKE